MTKINGTWKNRCLNGFKHWLLFKCIKGCSTNASLNKGLWTYINWCNISITEGEVPTSVSLPQIKVVFNGTVEADLGQILTNNVECYIHKSWRFYSGIYVDTIEKNTAAQLNINNNVNITGDTTTTKSLIVNGTISAKDKIIAEKGVDATGPIICTNNYIQALYFDATSDIRAKTDIKQLNIKAVELIKDLSIYTFKYKENNEPSIGIMAQDLLKLQSDGLDLVVNKNATGKDNDYMSIKEDKLIYILMKAIQEQQSEIEALKSKIDLLSK